MENTFFKLEKQSIFLEEILKNAENKKKVNKKQLNVIPPGFSFSLYLPIFLS